MLSQQMQVYWNIMQCWNNPPLAVKRKMTFGRVVKELRAIITAPANPRICLLATRLLEDITKNTASPEVPEEPARITGKRARTIIIDDILPAR